MLFVCCVLLGYLLVSIVGVISNLATLNYETKMDRAADFVPSYKYYGLIWPYSIYRLIKDA